MFRNAGQYIIFEFYEQTLKIINTYSYRIGFQYDTVLYSNLAICCATCFKGFLLIIKLIVSVIVSKNFISNNRLITKLM